MHNQEVVRDAKDFLLAKWLAYAASIRGMREPNAIKNAAKTFPRHDLITPFNKGIKTNTKLSDVGSPLGEVSTSPDTNSSRTLSPLEVYIHEPPPTSLIYMAKIPPKGFYLYKETASERLLHYVVYNYGLLSRWQPSVISPTSQGYTSQT
ncbi:hypothetical protein Acr_02g0012700 [Actinidia rufa]|uniref:Uncharacterized protein n=1 Tax=Actinidia rufa TaxID=165716 RepID=A0A7J0E9F0_9ERIC|nr:hypothetical protein Acr_02g0012700 [Actinidia rufa]